MPSAIITSPASAGGSRRIPWSQPSGPPYETPVTLAGSRRGRRARDAVAVAPGAAGPEGDVGEDAERDPEPVEAVAPPPGWTSTQLIVVQGAKTTPNMGHSQLLKARSQRSGWMAHQMMAAARGPSMNSEVKKQHMGPPYGVMRAARRGGRPRRLSRPSSTRDRAAPVPRILHHAGRGRNSMLPDGQAHARGGHPGLRRLEWPGAEPILSVSSWGTP